MLYEKDSYKNPNIVVVFGKRIYEHDLRSAGFNISREYKLLSDSEINRLLHLPKKERQIAIGLLMRKDSTYKENLKKGFINARKFLFESNNLQDDDIITIKKDAIFTLKKCNITTQGFIEFRIKNIYSSYIRLGYMEIFYNSGTDVFEVKGMDDENVKLHNNGILKFLKKYILWMENRDTNVMSKLMRFVNRYKKYDLPSNYYRTFDSNSQFVEKDNDTILDYILDEYNDDNVKNLDITYNYMNVIVPIVEITFKLINSGH